MGKFLGEDITYINQNDVNNALRFIRQNPDATQRAVWNLFIQQKFFTNNDFSFIDVHNEKLFYQNAEVLLKILQMWQNIRLTNQNGHNQFLGDMFEGFLDQGIKQSEGQFFTPMPICRFILMSLPLESLIKNSPTPPMAIDFACGAGHFLTELALQIQPLLKQHKPQSDLAEYHRAMYGMEKEYRLSKVAKVSAFMYGQQDIHICYGDALVNAHEAFPDIRDGNFDLLVANPPYSVRGFLETLPDQEREAYTLTKTIHDAETANSIETFFVERAKQLLKSGGVAAIILPSSILSNGGATYIRAREILLQYFDIIAIAEFGSGTFGKTGTNTVTLFLRRKQTSPDTAEHYRERVEEWFKGHGGNKRKHALYKDRHLIEQYCAHINVPVDDYQTLLNSDIDGAWIRHEHFKPYADKFKKSAELVNLRKLRKFQGLPKSEQEEEIAKRYLNFVQAIERDKLYHFVMASNQRNPVLIIRSPSGTKEIKHFLGYEWSSSKGDEGIKLIEDATGKHVTALYDGPDRDHPTRYNRRNPAKLNHYVVANFDGELGAIPDELQAVANSARLVDMLDFSRAVFEKQLALLAYKKSDIETRWPKVKLSSVTQILNGGTPDTKKAVYWEGGDICWATLVDTKQKYLTDTQRKITKEGLKVTTLLPLNTVIFSSRATIGEVCINRVPTATNQGYKNFVCNPKLIDYEYLYQVFVYLRPILENLVPAGSKYKEINTDTISNFQIPLPPLDVQQQIADACKVVEKETEKAQKTLTDAKQSIEALTSDISTKAKSSKKLGIDSVSKINPSKAEIKTVNNDTLVSFVEMASVSEAGFIASLVERPLGELRKGSYTYFAENDIIVAKITPCMENGKCALAKGLTNGLGMGSSEFHVIRANTANFMPEYLFALLNRKAVRQAAEKVMTGSSGHRRVPASFYENFPVPIISLKKQKQIVSRIEALEKKIAAAQAVIDAAPAKKEAIMKRYL